MYIMHIISQSQWDKYINMTVKHLGCRQTSALLTYVWIIYAAIHCASYVGIQYAATNKYERSNIVMYVCTRALLKFDII